MKHHQPTATITGTAISRIADELIDVAHSINELIHVKQCTAIARANQNSYNNEAASEAVETILQLQALADSTTRNIYNRANKLEE